MANGYFRIDMRNEGSYVVLYPPKDGGNPIKFHELEAYLLSKGLNDYKKVNLKKATDTILETGKPLMLRVGDKLPYNINEEVKLYLSEDKMTVSGRFFAPSTGGSMMDSDEIARELKAIGVKNGIEYGLIRNWLSNKVYCTDVLLAKGQEAIHGEDDKIEYYFNTNPSLKPAMNEDGTVDYKSLHNIAHVEADQLLAKRIQGEPGAPGMDVMGNILKPRTIKEVKLNTGNNIRLSEDGNEMYSTVTGHASLVSGQVFISDIYEIPADVDNTTGDITYSGNVQVKGNVKTGFSIKTEGDIIVDGVVEGATLKAGGQIVLKRGVQGVTKAVLKAEGNILCKFIENATVVSGGYIETESILHSNVTAKTEINVTGKKGFVTGGKIQAGNKVTAKKIGAPMGSRTVIEVGMSLENKERYDNLKKEINSTQEEINKAYPILQSFMAKIKAGEKLPAKNMIFLKQLAEVTKAKEALIKERSMELKKLELEMAQNTRGSVEALAVIYPGVEINISNTRYTTSDERSHCRFTLEGGVIKVSTI